MDRGETPDDYEPPENEDENDQVMPSAWVQEHLSVFFKLSPITMLVPTGRRASVSSQMNSEKLEKLAGTTSPKPKNEKP